MIASFDKSTEDVLMAAVSFLKVLHDDVAEPHHARRRLRQFQGENPGVQFELLTDEEAFEQTFHYDLLVRFSDQEAISLSYCHDHGIPWAMRGARRWTERDVLRVNDVVLHVDEVLGCMEFDSNDHSSMQHLVNIAIMRAALEREHLPVSPDELQAAMDAFRRNRKLHRAADTQAWLRERGISHDQLEGMVFQQAMAAKLRMRVVAHDVESYFHDHQSEFDTAAVALIVYQEETAARDAAVRIRRREIGFYEAAEENALGNGGTSASIVRLRRCNMPPEFAEKISSAAGNDVIGPIRFAEGWAVVRLLAVTPATLDGQTRQIIEKMLFDRWLEQQRATARIEWYWGNVAQTGTSP